MFAAFESPIKEVSFGEALNISLNSYYDLLKEQAGSLEAKEFLQLKLVADGLDIAEGVGEGKYEFFSLFNLIQRADLAIDPTVVSGTVMTGAVKLHSVYERFLLKLNSLISIKNLSREDQLEVDGLTLEIGRNKDKILELYKKDSVDWEDFCKVRGIDTGDIFQYTQWSPDNGQIKDIEGLSQENDIKIAKRNQIIQKRFDDPQDKLVVDAVVKFYDANMRLCYPRQPDFKYKPQELSLGYLARLTHASTALFEDCYDIGFDKSLKFIKTTAQGELTAKLTNQTNESRTMQTDWGASGSVRYGFIKVNANAEEHKKISEDFKKGTEIQLKAKATIRVKFNYGGWFSPELFEHPKVKEKPELFKEFFGENGSLLYYPIAFILIRGFSISFKASSEWKFDYEKKFKASAGGGFNVFGINFGGSSNYGQNITEHKFHQSGTELSISDADDTLRFVGYAVKKNDFFEELANNFSKDSTLHRFLDEEEVVDNDKIYGKVEA